MKKMKKVQSFVGIDVSKLTIDVCLLTAELQPVYHQFENGPAGFLELRAWLRNKDFFGEKKSLFCMEHTGLYTRQLVGVLLQWGCSVWMESALHLKRSMGITRGKSDKVDSFRIARYAMTNADKAVLVQYSSTTLQKLKDLMSNRSRIMKALQAIRVSTQEVSRIDKNTGKELLKMNAAAIKGLVKSKAHVDKRILEIIRQDEELNKLYNLVSSVKCVGEVLTTELIVYTNGFTRMKNTSQLACYCGVAPFEHSSGTSIKGRIGTSNFANMHLKSTLHMAAVSATRYAPDIKQYYERKVAEGKNKKSVINAIRNKLIGRIMAVIKRGTPYQENYNKFPLEVS